jgi:hypothetical protein
MTTAEAIMRSEVVKAVDEIKAHYAPLRVEVHASPCGGAYVIVHEVPLGPPYAQATTWVGFFITNACPYADVYPFWVREDLSRLDGAALKVPLHPGRSFERAGTENLPAIMVSRRQNHASAIGLETPLIKLQTVLLWMLKQ